MPLKVTKEMSSHLIKYVRTVDVHFNREFVFSTDTSCQCVAGPCPIFISLIERSGRPTLAAFDARTRSARELLRQVNSERMLKGNPKLKVNPRVNAKPDAPFVKFAFVDGTDMTFDSREYLASEMLMDVWRTTMKMDDDFEMEGKNVDDL